MNVKVKKKEFDAITKIVGLANYTVRNSIYGSDSPINQPLFYIQAENGKCYLMASNENVMIRQIVPAEIIEEGVFAVNDRQLLNAIPAFKDTICIQSNADKSGLDLSENTDSSSLSMTIATADKRKFNIFPEPSGLPLISGQGSKFAYCLKAVLAAVPSNGIQAVLNNLCIDYTENAMVFVGFDSYQMMKQSVPLSNPCKEAIGKRMLIDVDAAACVERIFRKNKNITRIILTESSSRQNLYLHNDSMDVIVGLQKGAYPDYKMLITEKHDKRFTMNQSEFGDIIKSIKGIGNSKEPLPVLFRFNNNDQVTLRFVTPDATIVKTIKIDEAEGELKEFRLLGKALKNAIPYLGKKIEVLLNDSGLATIKAGEGTDYLMVTRIIE